MKVFLLNHNPVVSRLAKLSLEKMGYELEEIASITQISGKCADIFICDSELIDPNTDYTPYGKELLFLVPRNFEKKVGKNMLEKPFLPTDFVECIQKITNKTSIKTTQEKPKDLSKDNFTDISNKASDSNFDEFSLMDKNTQNQEAIIPELDDMDEIKLDDKPKQNTLNFSNEDLNKNEKSLTLSDSLTLDDTLAQEPSNQGLSDEILNLSDEDSNKNEESNSDALKEKELNELSLMVDEIDNLSENKQADNINNQASSQSDQSTSSELDFDSANDDFTDQNNQNAKADLNSFDDENLKFNGAISDEELNFNQTPQNESVKDDIKFSDDTAQKSDINTADELNIGLNDDTSEQLSKIDEAGQDEAKADAPSTQEQDLTESISDQGQYQMFGNLMFNNQNEPEKDEILNSSDDESLKGEVLENSADFKIIDENADEKKDEILNSSDDESLKGEVLENSADFKIIDENADKKKDEILNKKANENLKFSVDENLKKDETTQDNMDFKIIDENADEKKDEILKANTKSKEQANNQLDLALLDDEFLELKERDLASALGESIPEPEIIEPEPAITEPEVTEPEPKVAEPKVAEPEPEITKPEPQRKVIRLRFDDDIQPALKRPALEVEPKMLEVHPDDSEELELLKIKRELRFKPKDEIKESPQILSQEPSIKDEISKREAKSSADEAINFNPQSNILDDELPKESPQILTPEIKSSLDNELSKTDEKFNLDNETINESPQILSQEPSLDDEISKADEKSSTDEAINFNSQSNILDDESPKESPQILTPEIKSSLDDELSKIDEKISENDEISELDVNANKDMNFALQDTRLIDEKSNLDDEVNKTDEKSSLDNETINESAQILNQEPSIKDEISELDEVANVYENAIKEDENVPANALKEDENQSTQDVTQKSQSKLTSFASKIKASKKATNLDEKELDLAADIYERAANQAQQAANERVLDEAKDELSTKLSQTLGATLANSTIKEALKDLNIKINISFEDK